MTCLFPPFKTVSAASLGKFTLGQALEPVLPDLSLLISIVLGQRFFGPALSVFSASLIQSRGLEVLSSRPRHAQPSADWAQRKRITLGHNDVMARAQVLSH